jgi:outer membrane receptor for ferrienterochelin and colicins
MNGLEGAYSQILINSRPVISALAGVYGLDMVPANMIDRIEVIRGADQYYMEATRLPAL